MARAQQGGIITGGLSPDVTGMIAQRTGARENRMMEAMRQTGQTQRTKMAGETQTAISRAQIASSEKVAAMEAEIADKRTAAAIEGQRLDREATTKRDEVNNAAKADAARLEREYEDAVRAEAWEQAQEIQEDKERREKLNNMNEVQEAMQGNTIIRKQIDAVKEGKALGEKLTDDYNRAIDEAEKDTKMVENVKEEVARELATTTVFDNPMYPDVAQQAFNKISPGPATAKMLTPEGKADLIKAISNGDVKLGDLTTAVAKGEGLMKKAAEEATVAKTKPQEDTVTIDYTTPWGAVEYYAGAAASWLIGEGPEPEKKIKVPTKAKIKLDIMNEGIKFAHGVKRALTSLKGDTTPITVNGQPTGQTVGQLVTTALARAGGYSNGSVLKAERAMKTGRGDTEATKEMIELTKKLSMEPNIYTEDQINAQSDDPKLQELMREQNEMMSGFQPGGE